ncbi:uncharacterized protein LOC131233484 isoform X2 [Magnolia sinica]|uniref:uncharacterized protein LOC131233484 isoform X2 n=1 Tax=Magnolia sinica TaxID=86752 RepID=UPI002659288C|nr:uncharacterized protein LOC131233484 isoform X2 [Magnolia sinica]
MVKDTAFLGASLSDHLKPDFNPLIMKSKETISKERDLLVCCICHRKHGVCIKCNHDDCQTAFHPTCAKRVGQHMDVKTSGGKFFQHKAYCEKHSLDSKKKPTGQSYLLRLQGLLRTIQMENASGGNNDVGLEVAEDGRAVLPQCSPSTTAPMMTGATMTLYYLWNLMLCNSLIELNFK